MGTIRASSTAVEFEIATRTGETVLEALRRCAIPAHEFILLDHTRRFVSLAHTIEPNETIYAYPVRSVDLLPLTPDVAVTLRPAPIVEIFAASRDDGPPGIVQLTRSEAVDYIYDEFRTVLDGYRAKHPGGPPIQIALAGGDSGNRVVCQCLGRYQSDHPDAAFHAVVSSNEFAESDEDLRETAAIADTYKIEHSIYGEQAAAKALGFPNWLAAAQSRHLSDQSRSGAGTLGPIWAQDLNFQVAYDAGRTAIVVGFNQEDVIVERLHQALTGQQLDSYPVCRASGLDLLAPLYKIPKKLIDALDVDSCISNCRRIRPPVSRLRSSMYLLAS